MILKALSDHNIMSPVCDNSGCVLETEVVIGSSIFISLLVYLISMLGIKPSFFVHVSQGHVLEKSQKATVKSKTGDLISGKRR